MKKLFLCTIIVLLTLSLGLCAFACSDNGEATDSASNSSKETTETITITNENYTDYFTVEVVYSDFTARVVSGTYIVGVYVPGYSEASVKQKITISPKANVVSCSDVKFVHYANSSLYWSYTSENSGKYSENEELNDWEISLDKDGSFMGSKTMYYCAMVSSTKTTCPSDTNKLNIEKASDVSGTVVIKK